MINGLFPLPQHIAVADGNATSAAARDGRRPVSERFIASPETVLVWSLTDAVVADPPAYNPIVLYGGIGAGKTTLAHWLVARRREQLQLASVIALTGDDLARALAHALEADAVADLRNRFHRCDLLLVDDLDHLAGKAAAGQFLLSSLDALLHRGSLIIGTLRRLPTRTTGLSPRLVSRLMGGLVVRLAVPSRLGRLLSSRQAPEMRVLCRRIAAAVSKHFDIPLRELRGKSRTQATADARGLAIYLARRLTGASYAQIGEQFGGRDHTTVLHACRKMDALVAGDQTFRCLADELASQILEDATL